MKQGRCNPAHAPNLLTREQCAHSGASSAGAYMMKHQSHTVMERYQRRGLVLTHGRRRETLQASQYAAPHVSFVFRVEFVVFPAQANRGSQVMQSLPLPPLTGPVHRTPTQNAARLHLHTDLCEGEGADLRGTCPVVHVLGCPREESYLPGANCSQLCWTCWTSCQISLTSCCSIATAARRTASILHAVGSKDSLLAPLSHTGIHCMY